MKIKRFVVFSGEIYYPVGGMYDFHSSYDTSTEAEAKVKELDSSKDWGPWTHWIDLENFTKDKVNG